MLHIEMIRTGVSTNFWKIEGLTQEEVGELNSMEYREMKEKIADIADSREHDHWNKHIGTAWKCGYGIYNTYIRDGIVCVETGKSCE